MLYYSEVTNKNYKTENECIKAEEEALTAQAKKKAEEEKKNAERKAAAERVENARKAMVKAQKAYRDELDAFVNKYHSYHLSLDKDDVPTLFDLFSIF